MLLLERCPKPPFQPLARLPREQNHGERHQVCSSCLGAHQVVWWSTAAVWVVTVAQQLLIPHCFHWLQREHDIITEAWWTLTRQKITHRNALFLLCYQKYRLYVFSHASGKAHSDPIWISQQLLDGLKCNFVHKFMEIIPDDSYWLWQFTGFFSGVNMRLPFVVMSEILHNNWMDWNQVFVQILIPSSEWIVLTLLLVRSKFQDAQQSLAE